MIRELLLFISFIIVLPIASTAQIDTVTFDRLLKEELIFEKANDSRAYNAKPDSLLVEIYFNKSIIAIVPQTHIQYIDSKILKTAKYIFESYSSNKRLLRIRVSLD